jgi:hypothetical protein
MATRQQRIQQERQRQQEEAAARRQLPDRPLGAEAIDAIEQDIAAFTQLPGVRQTLNFVGGAVTLVNEAVLEPARYAATDPSQMGSPQALAGTAILGAESLIEKSSRGGEMIAEALNVDPRIGKFIGGGAAEELLTLGAGKFAKGVGRVVDTLPPPGAAPQLAMAGAAPMQPMTMAPSFERGGLVMEARLAKRRGGRDDFMTQEQFDSQASSRVNAVRDKRDEVKEVIQNIEENNPGVKKGVLTATNKEYKRAKENLEDLEAYVSSEESNIRAPEPGNEWAYPPNMPRAREIKAAENDIRGTMEVFELHHLIPKGISAAMMNRVRDFIEDGVATVEDLKRFAMRPTELGLPDIGDLETNLNPMSRVPHSTFHTEMRYQGSYQFPGQKLEISKQNLATELRKITSFKDLEILWDEMLQGDIKYLVETNQLWEKADEVIKSVNPEYTGTARYKPPTKK